MFKLKKWKKRERKDQENEIGRGLFIRFFLFCKNLLLSSFLLPHLLKLHKEEEQGII